MTCVVCAGALPQPQATQVPEEAPQVRPEILRARRPSPLSPPDTEGLPPSSATDEPTATTDEPIASVAATEPAPPAAATDATDDEPPSRAQAAERAPVAEAPVVEAPVVEAPVVEQPVVEAPVADASADQAPIDDAPADGPPPASERPAAPPTRPTPAVGVRSSRPSSPPAVAPPSADPAPAPSGAPAAVDAYEVVPGPAPLGRAIVAMLVDGVVSLAPAAVVASLLAPDPAPSATLFEHVVTAMLLTPACTATFVLTAVALHTVHFALTIPRFGATLGGSVVGLGLRSSGGALLGPIRAAMRGLLGGLTGALFFAGPLYALWVDAQRRSLGDLLGGTRPVRHQLGGGR